MVKSLLFVESKPVLSNLVEEYHRWRDRVHIFEMLAVDGFVSARRWHTDGSEVGHMTFEPADVERLVGLCRKLQPPSGAVTPSRDGAMRPCGLHSREPLGPAALEFLRGHLARAALSSAIERQSHLGLPASDAVYLLAPVP
ncbi:hypothetical protein MMAN_22370 [Mycobacterium mantenii]|uniref:Uncharacterized protein n=1 Tax=Mycobacterium mantenii TaxID=560555 RepID=A0A1X0FSY7_MYCNT|nr:hypothetical protein BST30_15580 [Mycobacterium mantenii]BBY38103.1 hypothetical protein MMAN_22370 [Mycobacterium mantenii]